MIRAFNLLEATITLTISVIALYFISPIFFRLHDHLLVQRESELLTAFLYQIQTTARLTRTNYAILVTQQAEKWCVMAVAKNSEKLPACHCFNPSLCPANSEFTLYFPQTQSELKANRQYPAVLTHIDGNSGNNSGGCLNIYKDESRAILQFQQMGVINVVKGKTRSQCQ